MVVRWRLSKTQRWRWWRRCRPPGGVHLLHLRRAQHPAQTGRQLGLWNKPGPSIMLQNPNYPTLRCWIFTISCPTLQQFYRISGKKSFETGRVYWIHQVVETRYVDYTVCQVVLTSPSKNESINAWCVNIWCKRMRNGENSGNLVFMKFNWIRSKFDRASRFCLKLLLSEIPCYTHPWHWVICSFNIMRALCLA